MTDGVSRILAGDFHGDAIQATENAEGKWVGVKSVCDGIKAFADYQVRLFQSGKYQGMRVLSVENSRGHVKALPFVRLDKTQAWLDALRPMSEGSSRERTSRYRAGLVTFVESMFTPTYVETPEGLMLPPPRPEPMPRPEPIGTTSGGAIEFEGVPFFDDILYGVRTGDGTIPVSVRRICESLGLNFSAQLRKLKTVHWSRVSMMTTRDSRGSYQESAVIPHDRIPMWLATINPRKVSEEIVEKLAVYQTEAADVLAKHFLPQPATQPGSAPDAPQSHALDFLISRTRDVLAILECQAEQEKALNLTRVRAEEALASLARLKG